MKIAMIASPFIAIPPDGTGPVELVISTLTEQLVRQGHEVLLYATGDSETTAELRYIYPKSFKSMQLDAAAIPNNVQDLILLEHLSWALHDAGQRGAEVIHSHNLKNLMFQRTLNIPQVFTMHFTFEDALGKSYMQNLFEFFNGFPNIQYIMLSQNHRKICPPAKNIHMIHHGIDVDDFEFKENKDSYLLCLSRLSKEKGLDTAIDIAKKAGRPLKIAGPSSRRLHGLTLSLDQQYEEKLLEKISSSPEVEYLGEADHQMKVKLLRNASALLFPIMWEEPFGLTLLESMACGTPVIAFNRGAVAEIIEHGVSGFVVDSEAEMIEKVGEIDQLSPAAIREYVARKFNVNDMAKSYERVYKKAIDEFRGGAY